MKEHIIKILKNNETIDMDENRGNLLTTYVEDKDYEIVAEEVQLFMTGFIEWFLKGNHSYAKIEHIDDLVYTSFLEGSKKKYTIFDIYDYWFANIYNKSISMLPVTSSQIKSVGYASNTLYIEFLKGTVYSYASVPESFFEALKKAESVGKYFASEVKGKFDFEKTDRIVTNGELK
jgi:hypothetical protein